MSVHALKDLTSSPLLQLLHRWQHMHIPVGQDGPMKQRGCVRTSHPHRCHTICPHRHQSGTPSFRSSLTHGPSMRDKMLSTSRRDRSRFPVAISVKEVLFTLFVWHEHCRVNGSLTALTALLRAGYICGSCKTRVAAFQAMDWTIYNALAWS